MREVKCARCGKIFYPTYEYTYKDCCSYTCYLHRDDNRKKTRSVNKYALDGTLISNYRSAAEASLSIDKGDDECIRTACRKKIAYRGYLWRYADEEV